MTRFFKIIATLEGVSLLALLFIAMPLKYIWEMPEAVRIVGMAHGLLFVGYIIMAIMLKIEQDWPWKKFLIICAASVVPFGTFYIENKYFKAKA
jgi:integral membrane protein